MGNSAVKGGAPAIQIAGALADGIMFQNLSLNTPIYGGYSPEITDQSFTFVMSAGSTYTSAKRKDVWLYSTVDANMVYDYTPDAATSGGSTTNPLAPLLQLANYPWLPLSGALAQILPITDISVYTFIEMQLMLNGTFIAAAGGSASEFAIGTTRIQLQWYDQVKQPLSVDYFFITRGALTVIPTKGYFVSITGVNSTTRRALGATTSAKGTLSISAGAYVNAESFTNTYSLAISEIANPTYSVGSAYPAGGYSFIGSAAVGKGRFIIPGYRSGRTKLSVNFGAAGVFFEGYMIDSNTDANPLQYPPAFSVSGNDYVSLPRMPIHFCINNTTAAAVSYSIGIVHEGG